MSQSVESVLLEEQVSQWRFYLLRRRAIHAVDIEELEDHLREQISALVAAGLSIDEALLVAVKRMGALDDLTREFAREHADRLWKQLVVLPEGVKGRGAGLGVNVILLANLTWSAVLYIRFLRGRGPFADLERWQTKYVPVYAVSGAIVVILFPLVFGYL
jgi:hypothetical protein